MPTTSAVPASPHEPVTAECAATYYDDLHAAYAFMFRVPGAETRFTVHAAEPDRYHVGQTYRLTANPATDTDPATPVTPADLEGDLS